MFYIYQLFNTLNGKIYIGKTNDIKRRIDSHIRIAKGGREKYKTHFQAIHSAIRKHSSLIEFTVIQEFCNENQAFEAEKYWINYYNSNNNKMGYNLTLGGEGVTGRKLSQEHILAIKKYNSEKIISQETKDKLKQATLSQNLNGERNHNASISNEDADKIRQLYLTGKYKQIEIANMFNIDQTTVSNIIRNKSYVRK